MKRIIGMLLVLVLMLITLFSTIAYADGEGNIDHGGGNMGDGTNENFWNPGDEGVRVTVIRISDRTPVTVPIDFTNNNPGNLRHFGKVSKIVYNAGKALTPSTGTYTCNKPNLTIPKIISSASGSASIEEIKRYFCSEYMLMTISEITGFNYNTLINGDYKILLEPIAYLTFGGVKMAMTATEAGLYDQQLNGGLRGKMVSLTHKNLPLGMFLEVPDLGYPAWSGSTTDPASNADIISSLGLGIVRFNEQTDPPSETGSYDYEYRVNTEVITAVTVRGGQADPGQPVSVTFNIGGRSYRVNNVYYPEGDSQLVWVRWTTPSTPQILTIPVSVSGSGYPNKSSITVKIVDLSQNEPPNPTANDRKDSYTAVTVPTNPQKTSASWGVWSAWWQEYWVWISNWVWVGDGEGGGHWEDRGWWEDHGWWEFDWNPYTASLSSSMSIKPDDKVPTASGKNMKSGYGINIIVTANLSTNQSSAVTGAQTAVTYFPEFQYKDYWRLLDITSSGYNARFEFEQNKYSTYSRRVHFLPVWFPNGSYTPYTYLIDCWTPAGMLSMNLTDTVTIQGSLWDDWHIAPLRP